MREKVAGGFHATRMIIMAMSFFLLGAVPGTFNLNYCIETARENAPMMIEAREDVSIKSMDYKQSRLKLYTPDLIVTPGINWSVVDGDTNTNTFVDIQLRGIFDGYEDIFNMRREKILLSIQNHRLAIAERETIIEVAVTYNDIVNFQNIFKIRNEIAMIAIDALENTQERLEKGLASPVETELQALEAKQRRLELESARYKLTEKVNKLARIMGVPVEEIFSQTDWPPPSDNWPPPYSLKLEEAYPVVLSNYHELAIIEKMRDEFINARKLAKAQFLPSPEVRVGRSYDFLTNREGYYTTLGLAIPLWMGGERYYQLKRVKILAGRFERRVVSERIKLKQELDLLIQSLITARQMLEIVKSKRELALLKIEDTRDEYAAGKITYSELINQEITVMLTAIEDADAQTAYYAKRLRLDLLMGETPF